MYMKSLILAALIAGCIPVCGFAAESPANPIVSDSYGSEGFVQDAYDAASKGVEVTFPLFSAAGFQNLYSAWFYY